MCAGSFSQENHVICHFLFRSPQHSDRKLWVNCDFRSINTSPVVFLCSRQNEVTVPLRSILLDCVTPVNWEHWAEIAGVRWAQTVGITLDHRSTHGWNITRMSVEWRLIIVFRWVFTLWMLLLPISSQLGSKSWIAIIKMFQFGFF